MGLTEQSWEIRREPLMHGTLVGPWLGTSNGYQLTVGVKEGFCLAVHCQLVGKMDESSAPERMRLNNPGFDDVSDLDSGDWKVITVDVGTKNRRQYCQLSTYRRQASKGPERHSTKYLCCSNDPSQPPQLRSHFIQPKLRPRGFDV